MLFVVSILVFGWVYGCVFVINKLVVFEVVKSWLVKLRVFFLKIGFGMFKFIVLCLLSVNVYRFWLRFIVLLFCKGFNSKYWLLLFCISCNW